MKCYFARPVNFYDSAQDYADRKIIQQLGLEICDPSGAEHDHNYKRLGMNYFLSMIEGCDLVILRATESGKITAGVAKEINFAKSIGLPVLEIPNLSNGRVMSVDETRKYLKEKGLR